MTNDLTQLQALGQEWDAGWRDIASAPKDGTEFICAWWWNDNFVRDIAKFYARSGQPPKIIQARYRHRLNPTHWMPLPAPPVAAGLVPDGEG